MNAWAKKEDRTREREKKREDEGGYMIFIH